MKKNSSIRLYIKIITLMATMLALMTGCRIVIEPSRDIRERMEAEAETGIIVEFDESTADPETGIDVEFDESVTEPKANEVDNSENSMTDTASNNENSNADAAGYNEDSSADAAGYKENSSADVAANIEDSNAETAETSSVEIIMVGDILMHMRVENSGKNETGEYNFNPIFDHTRDIISSADVALVNEEVIIGGEELGITGYPTFNAPYAIGDALFNAGFDVVCHATNHSLDKGKKGLVNCLEFWRNNHPEIMVTGIYDNEADAAPEKLSIIERGGIKIAILNYTYGTNGINPPADMPYAVSMLNEERVITQLELAEEEADFTIVCPHWGTEYNLGISADQEKWAQIFREHGADAVIGTHPHVIEPLVFYDDDLSEITNNHGNGDMPVFYSLGNFVNWTQTSKSGIARRMVGGMARLSISRKENGEVSIDEYQVIDLVCHLQHGYGKVTVYPLKDYTEELASQNEVVWQDPGFSIEYCEKLCDEVYGNADHY